MWRLLWLLSVLITHELGHYYVAKKEGIFKGFGTVRNFILPNPCVKLDGCYKSKWGYLSGIIGSLVTWPIFAYTKSNWFAFLFWIVAFGMIDIMLFLNYDEILARGNFTKTIKILFLNINLNFIGVEE
jgi:hypothetical protein